MGNRGAKGQGMDFVDGYRHFVLKTPIKGDFKAQGYEECVFGTGCFWGAEKQFFRFPGVITTAVGYAGAQDKNSEPTYEWVCSGKSGHAEVVYVVWDPKKISFTDLVRLFLQQHNPTQKDAQGNDRGTQYRGALYYTTTDQKEIAEAAIAQYEKQIGKKIQTEVKELDKFYYAEEYHQQYLARPGNRQYCSAAPLDINLKNYQEWLPEKFKQNYTPILGEDFWAKHAPKPHCVLREPNDKIV
eukprot:CAMPEP_0203754370 /NCGR_PEP_ID=MMETSP0098-20131031/7973_1 /ASSEMBLY_ACC=CAM_ASM_000208 /TAXON_ID=96639 /ORGANISM=" , Strain NY0313808BC1" /LENGTH=241 /DNA_ID=CAMNT_0050645337 /DNA_START=72 /DNA_END=794 /DNA_ORIENTATION=+